LLEKIENGIINYILEGINYGVDIVSFADPAGTIDIVGPKVYKEVSGKFTYNILKKLEEQEYIYRKEDSSDTRKKLVYVTDKSRAFEEEFHDIFKDLNRILPKTLQMKSDIW
jgi:DNA-binding PadR family transcriptional regulator